MSTRSITKRYIMDIRSGVSGISVPLSPDRLTRSTSEIVSDYRSSATSVTKPITPNIRIPTYKHHPKKPLTNRDMMPKPLSAPIISAITRNVHAALRFIRNTSKIRAWHTVTIIFEILQRSIIHKSCPFQCA